MLINKIKRKILRITSYSEGHFFKSGEAHETTERRISVSKN